MKAADDFEHLLKQLSGILTPKQLTIFLLKDVFSFQHRGCDTISPEQAGQCVRHPGPPLPFAEHPEKAFLIADAI